jgi:hypothetical protein
MHQFADNRKFEHLFLEIEAQDFKLAQFKRQQVLGPSRHSGSACFRQWCRRVLLLPPNPTPPHGATSSPHSEGAPGLARSRPCDPCAVRIMTEHRDILLPIIRRFFLRAGCRRRCRVDQQSLTMPSWLPLRKCAGCRRQQSRCVFHDRRLLSIQAVLPWRRYSARCLARPIRAAEVRCATMGFIVHCDPVLPIPAKMAPARHSATTAQSRFFMSPPY